MFNELYSRVKEFKRKYPLTVAFRLRSHAKVAAKYIGSDEKILYVFCSSEKF